MNQESAMIRLPFVPFLFVLASFMLGGCATTSHNPVDPFEPVNRGVYQFNDTLDKAVVKPLAKGYKSAMPAVGKMMLSSFFSNLDDVTVAVNDLLQFKVAQAASDTGRILVNTTFGLCGVADIATALGMEKHNEDFGQTLGYWGFGSGPYIVLPFLGPSSVRDSIGLIPDSKTNLINKVKKVDTRNEATAMTLLDKRARLLNQEKTLDEAAIDRYAFMRDAYLQHRLSEVYDGNPPREKYDDEGEDNSSDKRSANDKAEILHSVTAINVADPLVVHREAMPTDLPVTTALSFSSPKPPAVVRVWVSQSTGGH
jgi:phospholipid-binding lipoprotein MlaA